MDLREVNNLGCIEEEVNHWWIRTRFNYINETVKCHNSKNINIRDMYVSIGNTFIKYNLSLIHI